MITAATHLQQINLKCDLSFEEYTKKRVSEVFWTRDVQQLQHSLPPASVTIFILETRYSTFYSTTIMDILKSAIHFRWFYIKEGPLKTSNQLLSPYTVALRLR